MGFSEGKLKNHDPFARIKQKEGTKIAIHGQMTINKFGAHFEIAPSKSEFTQLLKRVCPGICEYFSEKLEEKRKVSVSFVKNTKKGCQWQRGVV